MKKQSAQIRRVVSFLLPWIFLVTVVAEGAAVVSPDRAVQVKGEINSGYTATASAASAAAAAAGAASSLAAVPAAAAFAESRTTNDSQVVAKPVVKKKKKFPVLLVVGGAVVVGTLVYFLVIKKKTVKYTLSVTLGEGVAGTPAAGSATYKKGEVVSYQYTLQGGYSELHVLLDGSEVAAAGTITMDRDHALVVSGTPLGSLRVKSNPTGAAIFLDGSDTGKKTDATLENLVPGSHILRLEKMGYWDYETTVTVAGGQQVTVSADLEKGVTIDWITIPAGEFEMGDSFNEGVADELPVHTVYLDIYSISKYEVTFEQYDRFCDDTGRTKPGDQGWGRGSRPVINVTWYDAAAFCQWLSTKTGADIHLPTEAQWEKAAHGSTVRRFPWGNQGPDCTLANYIECGQKTKPVGTLPLGVSPYGLHNMGGNVWEWTQDWYDAEYYSKSPYKNPQGPSSGTLKTRRAGCIYAVPKVMRVANRRTFNPNSSHDGGGFRVVKE